MTSCYGPSSPQIVETTRGLITYLRDLVRSSRRAVRDLEKFEEVVWLHDVPANASTCATASVNDDRSEILSLRFEPKIAPPQPPAVLVGRLDPVGVNDPFGDDPVLRDASRDGGGSAGHDRAGANSPAASGPHRAIEPGQHAGQVAEAYASWVVDWRAWAAAAREALPRQRLHEMLIKIARTVAGQDDVYEAVLAVGLLARRPESGPRIRRHLAVRRLRISVDKATTRIRVALDPDATLRLEDREFLHDVLDYRPDRLASLHDDLATFDQHPLSAHVGELLEDWSQRAFDVPVRYSPESAPPAVDPDDRLPSLSLAPAIILRVRDRHAVVEIYERILSSLTGTDPRVPLGLAQLVAPLEHDERMAWPVGGRSREALLGPDPLFPLATNEDQRAILDRLQTDTAVVVQGPPGTGKTHTTANLVSALLARGLRVLVTSQKEQTLRVLREKLPEAVRDLCVMLVRGGRGGTGELERTLTALSDHAATVRPEALERSVRDLDQQRADLRKQRKLLMEQIGALREAEASTYEPAPGYRGTPAGLVLLVAQDRARYDWMPTPGPLCPGELPLGVGRFAQLRDLLRSHSPARGARNNQWLPEMSTVPDARAFAELVDQVSAGTATVSGLDAVAQQVARLDLAGLDAVEELVREAAQCLHDVGVAQDSGRWRGSDWRNRALGDVLSRSNTEAWHQLSLTAEEADKARGTLTGPSRVDLPGMSAQECADFLHAANGWREHLRDGGKPRRMLQTSIQKQAEPFLNRCAVSGRRPETAADMTPVITTLEALTVAHRLDQQWRALKARSEPAEPALWLGQLAERARALAHVAAFGALRDRIDQLLVQRGIRIMLDSGSAWTEFTGSLHAARVRIQLDTQIRALEQLEQSLSPRGVEPAPEVEAVRVAVKARDPRTYAAARQGLAAAVVEQAAERTCRELLRDLCAAHRPLADMLCAAPDDPGWDDVPSVARAWAWAVTAAFCERHRHAGAGLQQMEEELTVVEQRVLTVTGQLAGKQGWAHCLDRMDQRQRKALAQLKTHLKNVGAGEGRYAARARAAARDAMASARGAVPVWIAPLHEVIETLPPEPDSFDVVIVDEASQVGLDGLFLLWLAARVIVVGDDKQCVPVFGGEHQQHYDRLDEVLADLPRQDRQMFAPNQNLYELMSARFPDVVRLKEHFRCMPEIIGWSSEQFYDRSLIPLRQYGADRLDPLQVVHVEDGEQIGRLERIRNPVEAERLVQTLQQLLEDHRYAKRTFGVITLQGSAQIRVIEDLILQNIDPPTREQHRIRVGKPADFQGDERDVVLLSMVVEHPKNMLTHPDHQRRFNVAASRARDQMWLFTSVRPERLKKDDLRTSLIGYMQSRPIGQAYPRSAELADVRPDRAHAPFESLFEQQVYLRIRQRGYAVVPQVSVGAKRIDLVVYGATSRLAVECDGDVFHSTEQLHDDMLRERELARAGWHFWRVRHSEFADDPEAALASLWTELAARGIEPGVHLQEPDSTSSAAAPWKPIIMPTAATDSASEADGEEEDDEEDEDKELTA